MRRAGLPARRADLEPRALPGAEAPAAAARLPPFIAHVVHELRTPIGGVMGMASLLMMPGLDPTQQRYAKLMQGSAQTLLLLVNDILDLAKLERGQFTRRGGVRLDIARRDAALAGHLGSRST